MNQMDFQEIEVLGISYSLLLNIHQFQNVPRPQHKNFLNHWDKIAVRNMLLKNTFIEIAVWKAFQAGWMPYFSLSCQIGLDSHSFCCFNIFYIVKFFHLLRLKPSISTHSKPCMMPRTMLFKCLVLQHSIIKIKHLRSFVCFVRGFEWVEIHTGLKKPLPRSITKNTLALDATL